MSYKLYYRTEDAEISIGDEKTASEDIIEM